VTPEGKIENYLIDRVRGSGGRIRKLKWIGRNGAPDRILWWPGRMSVVVFVEVKAPGEKPDGQQEQEIAVMKKDDLYVHVVDSKESIDRLIYIHANEHEPEREPQIE